MLRGEFRNGTGESMNRRQKGFSLIELLIVVTIILIISAIAIPNLMRSKMSANEAAAIGALKALTESAVMYSNSYGGFPHSISNLGPSGGGPGSSSAAADLIDSGLATGVKSGYKFTFSVVATDAVGNVVSYSITAVPVTPGSTGQRSFYTDQSGTIRVSPSGTADSSSPPIG
jgi:type IV pilus assembly protein PilA